MTRRWRNAAPVPSRCAVCCPRPFWEKSGASIPRPSPKFAMTRGHVRDAEELHDALLTLIALPASHDASVLQGNRLCGKLQDSLNAWNPFLEQLAADRRASLAHEGSETYWVAAERVPVFSQIFSSAHFEAALPSLGAPTLSRDESL